MPAAAAVATAETEPDNRSAMAVITWRGAEAVTIGVVNQPTCSTFDAMPELVARPIKEVMKMESKQ